MSRLFYRIIMILLVAALLLSACRGGKGGDETNSESNNPAEATLAVKAQPTIAPEGEEYPVAAQETEALDSETAATAAPGAGASSTNSSLPKWTILLYMDADDEVLEEDIFLDLNEAELAGSSPEVQVVAQLDRFKGGYTGDGNWTETRRYLVEQDSDMRHIASPVVENIGEADMGDPQTLVDFIEWGMQNYPAQKYILVLSDHGSGWPGGWSDPDPVEDSQLYTTEIVEALAQVQKDTGFDQYELLGFDACLMSQVEVYTSMQPFARYIVASEEIEPSLGWAYTAWIGDLVQNPDLDGAGIAEAIVASYVVKDQVILDDQVRAEVFGDVDVEDLSKEESSNITMSAVATQALPQVLAALDELAMAMSQLDSRTVAKARSYAQSFSSVFGPEYPSPYLDLAHFAKLLAQKADSPEVSQAAETLQSAIQAALVAEKHGADRPGALGMAFYFPVSQMYADPDLGASFYDQQSLYFQQKSSYGQFLAAYYTGQPFEPQAEPPARSPSREQIIAPGASAIKLQPIQISTDTIGPDGTATLESAVEGDNIAYVYTFVGYVDEVSGAMLVLDKDFVVTDNTAEVDGVYYPDFAGGEQIPLTWEWTPTMYFLNDGQNSGLGLFEPFDYGAPDQSMVYNLYGLYQPANGRQAKYADLLFVDGKLQQAISYSGQNGAGAPWKFKFQPGDQFTVLDAIATKDETGKLMITYQEGDTFTYGPAGFTWQEIAAPDGYYVLGFIAVDFDGNEYSQFAPLTVTK